VIGVRMPYRTSSPESLEHAQLVIDKLGIPSLTIDISDAVDGYLKQVGDADPHRLGNVMARERMIVQFDLSAKHKALPLGTSNNRSGCSAISPGTATMRRPSIRWATCSRRRSGRSRGTSGYRKRSSASRRPPT